MVVRGCVCSAAFFVGFEGVIVACVVWHLYSVFVESLRCTRLFAAFLYGFWGGSFYVFFGSYMIFYAGLSGVYIKRNGIIVN